MNLRKRLFVLLLAATALASLPAGSSMEPLQTLKLEPGPVADH